MNVLSLVALACGLVAAPATAQNRPGWLGEEMPLPLQVRSPRDLEFKALAERQYLVFNLLAGGKLAWDAGRHAEAAGKWEALLRVPNLDAEIARVVRPLAEEARRKAGGDPSPALPEPIVDAVPPTATAPAAVTKASFTVTGQVAGGGSRGPAGAVVWLRRKDGPTPRPRPMRGARMNQSDKTFAPHVLTVPVGTTVSFANKDAIFHNVFSLSKPNEFDSGLFKGGQDFKFTFANPGAVQVLCNIHANMLGYIVVVDSPWYAQVGRSGDFRVRNVPAGRYDLYAWHEASAQPSRSELVVGDGSEDKVSIRVAGDRKRENFVPDKYGKPRQRQLGY